MYIPGVQNIEGGALEAASAKTLAANAQMAQAAKSLGVGQKGAGRRKRKMRGGAAPNLNAHAPVIPEAGTVPGVSAMGNHLKNVDNLNQLRASAVGDKLGGLQPYSVGGGSRRTKRYRKAKNGRSRKRTHRRGNSRSTHRSRRSRRVLLKSMGEGK
jgi:hypothetical protein